MFKIDNKIETEQNHLGKQILGDCIARFFGSYYTYTMHRPRPIDRPPPLTFFSEAHPILHETQPVFPFNDKIMLNLHLLIVHKFYSQNQYVFMHKDSCVKNILNSIIQFKCKELQEIMQAFPQI
jgi:hypothetical protein